MKRSVVRVAGALLLGALIVSSVPAQRGPGGTATVRPMVYHEMVYLGDATLQKELKLTEEQSKKVKAFRETWLRGSTTFSTRAAKTKERTDARIKEGEKLLTDTLDAAQRARLRQIVLQQLADGQIRQIPADVLTELKVTADQRQAFASTGRKLADYLTKEQMQTWEKLTGPAFTQTLARQVPERSGRVGGGGPLEKAATMPTSVRAMRQVSVRDALGLTAAQTKSIDDALTKHAAAFGTTAAKANAAFDQALGDILQPKQKAALEATIVRTNTSGVGPIEMYTNARMAKFLDVTQEQSAKLTDVSKSRREDLAKLLLTEEAADKLEAKLKAFQAETETKLDAVLTPAQRERRQALRSAPVVSISSRFGLPEPTPLYYREIGTYLNSPALPEALKLTDEQKKQLSPLTSRYRAEMSNLARRIGTISADFRKKFEKELVDVLGAEKRARYRQIVLQQLEKTPAGLAGRSTNVWNVSEVIEGLKLSTEQREKLTGGTALASVLTPEQQKKWKEMKGEEYKGTLAQNSAAALERFTSTRPPVVPPRIRYLMEPAIQTDLKLTKEQIAVVGKFQEKWQQLTKDYSAWKPEDRPARLAKATEALETEEKQLLQAPQAKRFEQVLNQHLSLAFVGFVATEPVSRLLPPSTFTRTMTKGGLMELLSHPPASKAAGLSDEQRKQVKAIVEDHYARTRMITANLRVVTGFRTDDLVTRTSTSLREQTDKKLGKLLTEKQHAQVKDLVGEPFKGTIGSAIDRGRRGPGGTSSRPERR